MHTPILPNLPQAHPWGNSVIILDTVDSTNTRAKALAAAGAPHGTVVLADSQSCGRGRMGRSFCSPSGQGIYMSVILRPNRKPDQLMHLTCAAAVAVCNAVEEAAGFRPQIKWINDLVAGNRKLGGILTELSIDPRTGLTDYAIIGIGINCSQAQEDFPPELRSIACSAAMITGKAIDRNQLASTMIAALEDMSRRLFSHKADIMARYRKDCLTIGKQVRVLASDTSREAVALDVDDDGSLTVLFPDGRQGTVNCGEVSVRGLYGYV